ncbi:TolC family protein [Cupriavidus basilensis]
MPPKRRCPPTGGQASAIRFWNGLVDVALEDSLDLRAAAARVRQAHALVDAARANRMPRLDLNVNAERGRIQQSTFRDGEGGHFRVPPYRSSHFGTQLAASYEIDLFGRLALARGEAGAHADATQADRRAVRQWLIHDASYALTPMSVWPTRYARICCWICSLPAS